MRNKILKNILSFFFLFFIGLLQFIVPSSLHAKPSNDNPSNFGLKNRISNFIKDVVNDIVSISATEKIATPTPANDIKLATPSNHTTTNNISEAVAKDKTPTPAKNATQPRHDIIVIDNILYIDGLTATRQRVEELKQAGVLVGTDLTRYIPAETAKANTFIAKPDAKTAKNVNTLAAATKLTPATLGKAMPSTTAASPAYSTTADKVILADLYDEAIPCNYHYDNNWDNKNIHAYRYDLSKMPQTVEFLLTHGLGGDFVMPVDGGVDVTSGFGPRWGKHHNGIDLDLETGDKVKAAFDGKVRIAQYSSSFGYVVVVRHFNGLETTYAHLSKLMVGENQDVKAGTLIGLGGNTGRSRGSHLHFEVRYKGHPMNPREMIDFERNALKNNTFIIDKSYFSSSTPYEDAHVLGANYAGNHNHSHITKYSSHAGSATKYHAVRKGDTISEIADKYNVSVQKVCSLNKISTKTTLKPGRKLRVK
jgi:murein DD-endopeptidase MepM/ murein hydrolase activator NlpD